MRRSNTLPKTLLTLLLLTGIVSAETPLTNQTTLASADVKQGETTLAEAASKKLLYTTYFYTAGEAIVHGYEKDTDVRIVSFQNKTIWQGKVGEGEARNIPTGHGVFAFLADKKASILVGTPSSCTAVGYYVRDQNGTFTAKRFLTEIPSSVFGTDNQLIVWAWKDANVRITNVSKDKTLATVKIKAGERHVIPSEVWDGLNSNMLDIQSDADVSVQVFINSKFKPYDQGFHVPSMDGRVSGKIFRTYVGKTTEGHNDLNLINYGRATNAKVTDIDSKEVIWKGKIKAGGVHNLRLSGKYVRIESDDEISALVAPYNFQGYAEHHFSGGHEGTGIESSFITATSEQLWVFSYFDNNPVQITSTEGKVLWEGTLNAGHAQGYHPGAGVYHIKSTNGISVMGGSAACGAEYSPAGGLFRIDEEPPLPKLIALAVSLKLELLVDLNGAGVAELLKVATQIVEARKSQAKKDGKILSDEELNAPLSPHERARFRNVGISVDRKR